MRASAARWFTSLKENDREIFESFAYPESWSRLAKDTNYYFWSVRPITYICIIFTHIFGAGMPVSSRGLMLHDVFEMMGEAGTAP